MSDWWLAYWISEEKQHSMQNKTISSNGTSLDADTKFYITVYGALAGANTVSHSFSQVCPYRDSSIDRMYILFCCLFNVLA